MDPLTIISMFALGSALAAPVPRNYSPSKESNICLVRPQAYFSTEAPSWMSVDSQTNNLLVPVDGIVMGDARLLSEIEYYASLPEDWNGEGHPAVAQASLSAAETFIQSSLPSGLPLPKPMLGSSGFIEFYWDLPGGYVDVSFDEFGFGSLFRRTRDGQEEFFSDLNVSEITKHWLENKLRDLYSEDGAALGLMAS